MTPSETPLFLTCTFCLRSGRKAHMWLSVSKHRLLAAWKYHLCGAAPLTVLGVDVGFLRGIMIRLRSWRTRGGRRGSGATTHPPPWTPMDAGRKEANAVPPSQNMTVSDNWWEGHQPTKNSNKLEAGTARPQKNFVCPNTSLTRAYRIEVGGSKLNKPLSI